MLTTPALALYALLAGVISVPLDVPKFKRLKICQSWQLNCVCSPHVVLSVLQGKHMPWQGAEGKMSEAHEAGAPCRGQCVQGDHCAGPHLGVSAHVRAVPGTPG